jgi:hypothetical protein
VKEENAMFPEEQGVSCLHSDEGVVEAISAETLHNSCLAVEGSK